MKKLILINTILLLLGTNILAGEFKEINSLESNNGNINTFQKDITDEIGINPIKSQTKADISKKIEEKIEPILSNKEDMSLDAKPIEKPAILATKGGKNDIFDISEKETRDGIVYKKNSTTPFTGRFAIFLGDSIEYSETYVNGTLNGNKTWYSTDGNIVLIENYVNDKIEGEQKTFYENGNIKSIVNYKWGKIESAQAFDKNNKTIYQEKFENGNGTWKYFWENGNILEEGQYVNWKKDGVWKKYKKNGTIDTTTTYKNGSVVSQVWG